MQSGLIKVNYICWTADEAVFTAISFLLLPTIFFFFLIFSIHSINKETRLVVDRDKPRNYQLNHLLSLRLFDNVLLEHGGLPHFLPFAVHLYFCAEQVDGPKSYPP